MPGVGRVSPQPPRTFLPGRHHKSLAGYEAPGKAYNLLFIADRFVDTLTRRDLENVRERCRNDGLTMTSINA